MKKIYLLLLLFVLSLSHLEAGNPKKLFLLLGQSNMAGRAPMSPQDILPLHMVQLFNSDGYFESARNPLNRYSNIRKELPLQLVGPGYSFGKRLSEVCRDTIYLLVNARGGVPIKQFMKGDSSQYYTCTIQRIKQALKLYPDLSIEAIIWHQGESNVDDDAQYLGQLAKLTADYRQDLNLPDLPIIVGELGHWNRANSIMNNKLSMISDSISNAYCVSSESLTNIDNFHFDARSQHILGNRYAEKYIEILAYRSSLLQNSKIR